MRRTAWLSLGILVILAGCSGVPLADQMATSPDQRNATVVGVVDGDTIDVRFADGNEERVRLLGIDTPEVHVESQPDEYEGVPDTEAGIECLRSAGTNATQVVETRLNGEPVQIVFDPVADRRGGYGRLLAYVVHDGTNVNYWLVEKGHARVYDSEFTKADGFYDAEEQAMQQQTGVWSCTAQMAG